MSVAGRVKATVIRVSRYEDDVFKVDFAVPPRYTRFKAGQFLHLALDDYDPSGGFWPESRVFSICSRPKSDVVSIVYSVKGRFTSRMAREIAEQRDFWLKLPYGYFTVANLAATNQEIVLVAGGTGISPFVPFLEECSDTAITRPVTLIYGFRNPNLLLFSDLLRRLVASKTGVNLKMFCESGFRHVWRGPETVEVTKGIVSPASVLSKIGCEDGRMYFLSGPPAMLSSVRSDLIGLGVKEERIKIDEWE